MRTVHFPIVVAACTCGWITLLSPAFSQGPPPPDFLDNPPPPVLERFDADGDGKLNAAERATAEAEINDRFGDAGGVPFGGPPFGGPGGAIEEMDLVEQFDADEDGFLNKEERAQAREYKKRTIDSAKRGPGGRGPGGGRPPGGRGPGGNIEKPSKGATVRPSDVESFKGVDFYDPSVVRTLFFEFDDEDWEAEMADFYHTDVLVPAKLTVDGKTLKEQVGVAFRGNSSFFTVGAGSKRSLDVRIDAIDNDQNLRGYNTLNLLSGHADPSFIREALFSTIAGKYIPAPKVNFVKVVINGENWGIYVNSQQFNTDFLQDWFDTKKGVRWKVPAAHGASAGLVYNGDDESAYSAYQQKSDKKDKDALKRLINLCKLLNDAPGMEPDKIEAALAPVLDIDSALWFLAIDRVFLDGDGYLSRGSDFAMLEDEYGRFHMLPHDSNESFRREGAGGPGLNGGGPGGRPGEGRPGRGVRRERPQAPDPVDISSAFAVGPLDGSDDERTPLFRALMASPRIKARYLAHVWTLTNEWLDWAKMGPLVQKLHDQIADEVMADTKKLYSNEAFQSSIDGESTGGPGSRRSAVSLKTFVSKRNEALKNHADLIRPVPTLTNSVPPESPAADVPVKISVDVSGTAAQTVLLHYSAEPGAPFVTVPMQGSGTLSAEIPGQLAGTPVAYYIEALTEGDAAAAFFPDAGQPAALKFQIAVKKTGNSPIVINEVVPANKNIKKDPQGKYEDWIELHNTSDSDVVLDGYCLTDNEENLRKWPFPEGTTIPAQGYLIIWADEDGKDEGLHANFKLSKDGETVILSDSSNAPVDIVVFKNIGTDEAYARKLNAPTEWEVQLPSPGKANR
ncbi:MAG: CotH kinase family protein [Verrucomicrobiales bacterium]